MSASEHKSYRKPSRKFIAGDYIVLDGRPCAIAEDVVTLPLTGHLYFVCRDLFAPNIWIPHVRLAGYEVIAISDDEDYITSSFSYGRLRVFVTLQSAMGQSHIVGLSCIHKTPQDISKETENEAAQPQNDTTLTNVHKMDQVQGMKPSTIPTSFTQLSPSHIKLSNRFDSFMTT